MSNKRIQSEKLWPGWELNTLHSESISITLPIVSRGKFLLYKLCSANWATSVGWKSGHKYWRCYVLANACKWWNVIYGTVLYPLINCSLDINNMWPTMLSFISLTFSEPVIYSFYTATQTLSTIISMHSCPVKPQYSPNSIKLVFGRTGVVAHLSCIIIHFLAFLVFLPCIPEQYAIAKLHLTTIWKTSSTEWVS